jgi:hypothetical protein
VLEAIRDDDSHRPENVIDVLQDALAMLPPTTREMLRRAAFIGNKFRLSQLADASSHIAVQVASAVASNAALAQRLTTKAADHRAASSSLLAARLKWSSPLAVLMAGERADVQRMFDILEPALEGSFVLPAGESTFVFAHDRIQQACAALSSAESPAASHHRTARILLSEWIRSGGLTVLAFESSKLAVIQAELAKRISRRSIIPGSRIHSGNGATAELDSTRVEHLYGTGEVLDYVGAGGALHSHTLRSQSMPEFGFDDLLQRRVPRGQPEFENLRRLSLRDELLASLYNVASHFEAAVVCIDSASERAQVARIFWIVGRRALVTSAFEVALRYLEIAITLGAVPRDKRPSVQEEAQLTLPFWLIWTAVVRCMLIVKPADAVELLSRLANWARTEGERCYVSFMRVGNLVAQSRLTTALEIGLVTLCSLGLPAELTTLAARDGDVARAALDRLLAAIPGNREDVLALARARDCDNGHVARCLRALQSISLPAFKHCSALYQAHCVEMCLISLKHGMTELSCFAFAATAGLLVTLRRFEMAFAFASLSRLTMKRHPRSPFCGASMVVCGAFVVWRRLSYDAYVEYMQRALQVCVECADMTYASYALLLLSVAVFVGSSSLETCVHDLRARALVLAPSIGRSAATSCDGVVVVVQAALCLLGRTASAAGFDSPDHSFTERAFLDRQSQSPVTLVCFHVLKAWMFLLHDQYSECYQSLQRTEQYEIAGLLLEAERNFVRGLVVARAMNSRLVLRRVSDVASLSSLDGSSSAACGSFDSMSDCDLCEVLDRCIASATINAVCFRCLLRLDHFLRRLTLTHPKQLILVI